MTIPGGGVPNLPFNALTIDNIATRLQDMTPPAIRNLANQGLPGIFNASNGGSVLSDLTPFGVITRLFAEFASAVANADPNDIQGPEDLPGLMLNFIEGLPIIGELIGLLEAINGQYDGDDAVLLAVQQIFHPIRKLLQLASGQPVGWPTVEDVTTGWVSLADALEAVVLDTANFLAATGQATFALLGAALQTLISWLSAIPANLLSGALPTGLTFTGTPLSTLLGNLNGSGQFAASALTGGINTAVTFGGTALSTLFQYLNGSGQFNAAQLTGALNTSLTAGGTALSTLLQNINSTGGLILSGATGALNTAVTIGGQAVSTIFNGSGQFIGVLNSAATGALNTAVTVGGNAIGTLLTNINATGQFAGSAIIGAINTAATVGGTAIGTVATNAGAAVTNINSLISNVAGSTIADVNTFLNTASSNAQGSLNAIVNGVNNSALTGRSIAQAQTAVNDFVSGVVNNLQGIAGTFGLTGTTSANSAFAAAAAAAASQAANLALQQSAFNAVFNVSPATAGNINVTVDYSAKSNQTGMSGIMLPGSGSGSGYMGVTSGEAKWQGGTGDDLEVYPTQTVSDYQVIDVTLGSLNDLVGTSNDLLILFRVNSARTTYGFLYLTPVAGVLYAKLGCVVSGSASFFATSASGALSGIATGGKFRIFVGDPSSLSPYAMQVTFNGTPIITYTDAAHVSQLGASYRYVGQEMAVTVGGKVPAAIRTVTYQDNPPAPASYPFSGLPTAGTKGRFYLPNDVGLALRDNGTAWERFMAGPVGFHTAPPTTSWSWVNQGGATVSTDLGAEFLTAPTSTRNWRLRTRTLTPSSNYTATACIEVAGVPVAGSNLLSTGIGLRNSSSGSFITFGPNLFNTAGNLAVYRWTNATTVSVASASVPIYLLVGGKMPNWLRIRDDGTNRYFEYSDNGTDWIPFWSEGRTAFITPDQFCFGADNEASGQDCKIRLRSLAGIS